jgi:PIN domain nuclease of toxin-antitoxin system
LDILLDTNALIWLLNSSTGGSIGEKARKRIDTADNVYASSISVLEIRIKELLGKLKAPDELLEAITLAGLKNLSFSVEHAEALSHFPDLSRHDPFDRMLLAQAKTERIIILTSDGILLSQGIDYVVDVQL